MSSTIPKPTVPSSLAGKPPYATDEPDSFYETPSISPSQRIRAQLILPAATANSEMQNKRTSAYDVYDSYLPTSSTSASANPNTSLNPFAAPEDAAANRNSGLGALLLNLDDSDDESDDDDDARRTQPAMPSASGAAGNGNKHAALAAAVSTSASERAGQISPSKVVFQPKQVPPPPQQPRQQQVQFQQQQRGPQPIAAPQPGYPAPIAALNLAQAFPQAQGPPPMKQIPMPAPLRINPNIQNPFEPQMHSAHSSSSPFAPAMASPFPRPDSTSPHPLLPPVTPITPAFIRPSKNTSAGHLPPPAAIKFDEGSLHDPAGVRGMPRPNKAIIRGDTEETLLPSRGEKGDDFWRRFSMVAKLENKGGKGANKSKGGRESSWLARTQSGKDSYSRWVWVVGVVLLLIIVAAIGCGVYFTRGDPGHQQPKVFGGSADQAATYTTSATGKVVAGPGGTSTMLHVSPTNTVARREVDGPEPTMPSVVAIGENRMHIGANAKRRLQSGAW